MDNLELKAQELLDANKAKTIDEAKTIIAIRFKLASSSCENNILPLSPPCLD